MLAELSYFRKLWNKGVDISAGVITSVITSVIIGLIGLLFWRVKLWLDLRTEERKQRQEHRIAQELESEKRRGDEIRLEERLTGEREALAKIAESSKNTNHLSDCWAQFEKWLDENRLDRFGENRTILIAHGPWGRSLRSCSPPYGEQAATLAGIIRATAVTPEE